MGGAVARARSFERRLGKTPRTGMLLLSIEDSKSTDDTWATVGIEREGAMLKFWVGELVVGGSGDRVKSAKGKKGNEASARATLGY